MRTKNLKNYLADVLLKNVSISTKDSDGDYIIFTENDYALAIVLNEDDINELKTWLKN